ncbi:MAG TPA: hypothetical protein VN519_13185 [Bryobacteraceae bacterium]|nr:hypothetical protein [Bryobacteraceae bacterium]
MYFVSGYVLDASRSSGSAGTATAAIVIAARRAGLRLDAGSGAGPTGVISEALKEGSITGTVGANTGAAARA